MIHVRSSLALALLLTGCSKAAVPILTRRHPVARAAASDSSSLMPPLSSTLISMRPTTLAARGWTEEGGDLFETLDRLNKEGCPRYVVTDVSRDGTLEGPNLDLLESVCRATDRPVIASGGIGSLGDIHSLAELLPHGLEGAIMGKALYAGEFTLPEALVAAEPRHSYVRPEDFTGEG